MKRSTIFNGQIHYKWPFSIANYVSLPEGMYIYIFHHITMFFNYNPMTVYPIVSPILAYPESHLNISFDSNDYQHH